MNHPYEKLGNDESDERKPNPKADAGFFSQLMFSWLNGLVGLGNIRPLKEEDLPSLLPDHESESLTEKLEAAWEQELNGKSTPRLWKALYGLTPSFEYILIEFLAFTRAACLLWMTILLSFLLSALTDSNVESSHLTYVYGAAMCLCSLILTFTMCHFEYRASMVGIRVRAAVSVLLYKKVLRLSSSKLSDVGAGNVLNLVSNDVARFHMAITYLPTIVAAPIEIILNVVILCWLTGWQSTAGLIVIVAFCLLGTGCAAVLKRLRQQSASVTDHRISLTREVIGGIRTVKMYTWEWLYRDFIGKLRRKECHLLSKMSLIFGLTSIGAVGRTIISSVILLSLLVTGHPLSPHNVFIVLTSTSVLRQAVFYYLGIGLQFEAQCVASLCRIQEFLLTEESFVECFPKEYNCKNENDDKTFTHISKLNPQVTIHDQDPNAGTDVICHTHEEKSSICLQDVSCISDREVPLLSEVNLRITGQRLAVVTGPVGSGKSSLLMAMLEELPLTSGRVSRNGTVAFVPQIPWVFSGSVRENIIFYKQFDQERFEMVVRACELQEDIAAFPNGDLTPIGEHGVVLSGGQRARVSLARALYSDADIYLLDDPLSAVDCKVGKKVFEKCVQSILGQRLCVLVTHHLQYLEFADHVILMKAGRVVIDGTYAETMKEVTSLLNFSISEQENQKAKQLQEASSSISQRPALQGEEETLAMTEEDRALGIVTWRTYWRYFRAALPAPLVVLQVLFVLLAFPFFVVPDWWLSGWTDISWTKPDDRQKVFVYIGLVSATFVLNYLAGFSILQTLMASSSNIHCQMLTAILKAPVLFFDTNPTGRIVNRFAKDIGIMDENLPFTLMNTVIGAVTIILSFIVPSLSNYWILVAALPCVTVCMAYGRRYITLSREVARIQARSYSPVLSHFSSTIRGLVSIRTFRSQQSFTTQFYRHQDALSRAWFVYLSSIRWLTVRMNISSFVFFTAIMFCCLVVPTSPGLIGLSVVYAIQSLDTLDYVVRETAEVENMMTSVERTMAYTQLDSEPGYSFPSQPPEGWPQKGTLSLEDIDQVYYKGGPTVLKGITFQVGAREKVGIAGRTGAGKSSLVAALMRMPEPLGHISIDGVNLKQLNIQSARQSISVIPQEPVLFSGALRRNIDPFGTFEDSAIWRVLEDVHLKELVKHLDGQLYYELAQGGTNFSVGERQLICLARALLQGNKIIVMDEATANVDYRTDQLIQQTIRDKFKECTVLTIAHRINTVLDYDRVIVLHEGQLVEAGEPAVLLNKENGWFSQLYQHMHSH